jgi:hypothetical protein
MKKIVFFAVVAIVVCTVFPPWYGINVDEYTTGDGKHSLIKTTLPAGYGFIAEPPRIACKTCNGDNTKPLDETMDPNIVDDTATAVEERQPSNEEKAAQKHERFEQWAREQRITGDLKKRIEAKVFFDQQPFEQQDPEIAALDAEFQPGGKYFNNEELARSERLTLDLRRRIEAKRAADKGMIIGYTPEQNKQIEGLWEARNALYASTNFSPEQKREADNLIQSKLDSIIPGRIPRPPTPQQELKQRLISDGRGGQWIKNEKTGEWKQVKDFAPYDRSCQDCEGRGWTKANGIDFGRLGLQYIAIVVTSAGLLYLLRKGNKTGRQKDSN